MASFAQHIWRRDVFTKINRGNSLEQALSWIKINEEGLTAFQFGDATDRNEALGYQHESQPTFLMRRSERQQLYELSIFREDDAIPQDIAMRLWHATAGYSSFASGKLLRDLSGQFFQMRVEQAGGPEIIRFHDALRQYLITQLGTDRTRSTHNALLASYNKEACPWHTIANDGYLYNHLVYHLGGADRRAEIASLFDSDDWISVRFCTSGYVYTGYLSDFDPHWPTFKTPQLCSLHSCVIH